MQTMLYDKVVEKYSKIENTAGRLKIIDILAELIAMTPPDDLKPLVYLTTGRLAPSYTGLELGVAEKTVLKILSSMSSAETVAKMMKTHGDAGEVAEQVVGRRITLVSEPLTLNRVYSTLLKIAGQTGANSVKVKGGLISGLLSDATSDEAKYLVRSILGELRLGVADYTVLEALTKVYGSSRESLERAYNLTSDLGLVAELAAAGPKAVDSVTIEVGRPIRPMLAERLESADAVIGKIGESASEYKLDGERVQIHKDGDVIKIFSRSLERIEHYPDAEALARENIKAASAIVEAECVAVDNDGKYLPFQELMHRRRKYNIKEAAAKYPVTLNFFDVLLVNLAVVMTKPYFERREILEYIITASRGTMLMPQLITDDPAEVEGFMLKSLAAGGEGLMIKQLGAAYTPGARGFGWIKLKREYNTSQVDSMDLVVLGGFHGKGKRAGTFGAYLLGAIDPEKNQYIGVTKIGTGFTDQDLEETPKLLHPVQSKPNDVESGVTPDVWVEPTVVMEVVASEITLSPTYTAAFNIIRQNTGLALRFPRFMRIRQDKTAQDATTVNEIIEMYKLQTKKMSK